MLDTKYYDPELYEDASSDPYIVFSIDPPIYPTCKALRSGGYFGRTTRTDIVTNTLNPSYDEARKPLSYLGTRSELESEILHIRVFDWDFLSADDLIGHADVPLHGLLEYGQARGGRGCVGGGRRIRGGAAMRVSPPISVAVGAPDPPSGHLISA